MKILRYPPSEWQKLIVDNTTNVFYCMVIKGMRSAWIACVRGVINVYTEVEESDDKISTYYFSIHETGEQLPKSTVDQGTFLKTISLDSGEYMVHVYTYSEPLSSS